MTYIQGIDISKHQGDVDHAKVAASGMKFCMVKATEGQDYEDPKFADNIEEIRSVGKTTTYFPGAYHFARPDTGGGRVDGEQEAEDFCNVVLRVCGNVETNFMPPALDFEKYSDSDAKENIPWIEGWISVVERRLKRKPTIYTGANVWKYEVGNTDRFIDYPLWQVFYSKGPKPVSMPWPAWSMWQWSGGGSYAYAPPVPGAGVVDVNRFSGDLDALKIFACATPPAPPVNPMPSPVYPPPPPQLDLATLRGTYNVYTARVQGLLLAHGYGPTGLVGPDGLPDGKSGEKTEAYLKDFKRKVGLATQGDSTVVDWETFWMLALRP